MTKEATAQRQAAGFTLTAADGVLDVELQP
jgi:hypothetical protein